MMKASPRALARISAWGVRYYGSSPFQRTPVVAFPRNLVRTYTTDSRESNAPTITEGEQQLMNKLRAKFNPSKLSVQDVSGGCGTFYAISISSSAFKGLTTVKQHRLVTQELKEEVANIHGLQLKTIPE